MRLLIIGLLLAAVLVLVTAGKKTKCLDDKKVCKLRWELSKDKEVEAKMVKARYKIEVKVTNIDQHVKHVQAKIRVYVKEKQVAQMQYQYLQKTLHRLDTFMYTRTKYRYSAVVRLDKRKNLRHHMMHCKHIMMRLRKKISEAHNDVENAKMNKNYLMVLIKQKDMGIRRIKLKINSIKHDLIVRSNKIKFKFHKNKKKKLVDVKIYCKHMTLHSNSFKKSKKKFTDEVESMKVDRGNKNCKPPAAGILSRFEHVSVNFGFLHHEAWVTMGCVGKFKICFIKKSYKIKTWVKKQAKRVVAVFKAPALCFFNKKRGRTGSGMYFSWYFDRRAHCCRSFYFHGTWKEGGANMFHSLEQCKSRCHPSKILPTIPPPPKSDMKCIHTPVRISSIFHRTIKKKFPHMLIKFARVVHRYSHARCQNNYKFKWNTFEVKRGCRASFKICFIPGFVAHCESRNYKEHTCQFSSPVKKIQMVQQYSTSECVRGVTFFLKKGKLIVKGGCRAYFECETAK